MDSATKLAVFVISTDDETLKITMDGLKDVDAEWFLFVNGETKEDNSNWTCVSTVREVKEAYREIVQSCIRQGYDALIVRGGSKIEGINELLEQRVNYDIIMGTIINEKNTKYEMTNKMVSAFPIPKFTHGNRLKGTNEVMWIDSPVVYLSNKVIWENGQFDSNLTEHFSLVDYSVRARWNGFKVGHCHDCTTMYMNEKIFSSVLTEEESSIMIGQYMFQRKYGNSILKSLIGE